MSYKLNTAINKNLELMLAIHSVYLKNNPNMKEELDFVEVPPIDYINELENVINSVNHQEIIEDILKFEDCSVCIEIALGLDDNYNIDKDKINYDYIMKYLGGV